MNFTLERVSNPDIEPVTLDEIIQHVREFTGIPAAPRTELTNLIVGGREWAEDYTGRALIDQTWCLTLQGLPASSLDRVANAVRPGYYFGTWQWNGNEIMLKKSPVLAITSFKTVDAAGVETTIDPTTYQLREQKSKWPRVVALNGATWSTGTNQDLRITFRAGHADRLGSPQQGAEMVPMRFKQAIKLWVEANYDRDPMMMQKLLDAATEILKPERSELQIA